VQPTAAATITAFIEAFTAQRLDDAWAMLHPDVEYDNVPIGPMHGRANVAAALTPFAERFDAIDWPVTHTSATELGADSSGRPNGLVFNARIDRFRSGNTWVELPVAGVWEVTGGLITLWRDYFDLGTYQQQMAALG
jgi:limonene-1,2-epoxide hydrolase